MTIALNSRRTRGGHRPARQALTPLGQVGHLTLLGTGKREIGWAFSADRVWSYEHDLEEPATPWTVTHTPTGLVEMFGNLRSARVWTASDSALSFLAVKAFDDGRLDALLILGAVLPAGTVVDHRCECGGYLTAGDLIHVDTCEELHQPGECPDGGSTHRVCRTPAPVGCTHCRQAAVLAAVCEDDDVHCCGCCADRPAARAISYNTTTRRATQ